MKNKSVLKIAQLSLLLAFVLAIPATSFATTSQQSVVGRPQTAFFSYKKQKWGFKDSYGDVVIKPKYEYAQSYNDNLAIVKTRKQFGIIDQYGYFVVTPKYDSIEYATGASFIITVGKKSALLHVINVKTADVQLSSRYDDISYVKERSMYVITQGKYKGLLDSNGCAFLPTRYDNVSFLGKSMILVKMGEKYGLYGYDGGAVAECRYDAIEYDALRDMYSLRLGSHKGLLASDGREIIACKCDNIRFYDSGRFVATIDGKCGIYSNNGKVLVECKYDNIIAISKLYTLATTGDECVVFNNSNYQEVNRFKYDSCKFIKSNHLFASNGKYILLTDDNYSVAPTLYDSVEHLAKDLYLVKREDKYGVLSSTGKVLVPTVLDQVDKSKLGNSWQLCKSGDKYLMVSHNKTMTLPEFKKEFNNPWVVKNGSTSKTSHPVDFKKLCDVVKFKNLTYYDNTNYEEHIGVDTYTHSKMYKTITINGYALNFIRHQTDEEYYFYIEKDNAIVYRIPAIELFDLTDYLDVQSFSLVSIQKLSNGDILMEANCRIAVGYSNSYYNQYDVENRTCVAVVDINDFTTKYSVVLPENTRVLGISNYEGWYVATSNNVFYATSSSSISKYSNECELMWTYTPNSGEGFKAICETDDSFYFGGFTKNSGYIDRCNPYICRLDRNSGEKLGDKLLKQKNSDYCVWNFKDGYVQIKLMSSNEVESYDFSDMEPVKLELKRSVYNGVYAYGLVNADNEWVVEPVLPGEAAVVSGDWVVYPCNVKADSHKLEVCDVPVAKYKGEYVNDAVSDNDKATTTSSTATEKSAPEAVAEQSTEPAAETSAPVAEPEPVEEFVDEEIYITSEVMPTFQGGDLSKFRSWVMQHVKYPSIALENGVQGNVVVKFVVEKDGTLSNIQVLQSPDKTLSEAALEVFQKSPKWKPGKQRNKPVRVAYTLPISFSIKQ